MTNFEFYQDKILELIEINKGLSLINNKPSTCIGKECINCDLYYSDSDSDCTNHFIKWLYKEYKPELSKPKLTKKERELCETLKENDGYFARNEDGFLYFYDSLPMRKYTTQPKYWYVNYDDSSIKIDSNIFKFIKWEDNKPYSIKELLKLEVKNDD